MRFAAVLAALCAISNAQAQTGGLTDPYRPPGTATPVSQVVGTVHVRGDGSIVLQVGTMRADVLLLQFSNQNLRTRILAYDNAKVRVFGLQQRNAFMRVDVIDFRPVP